MVDFNRNDRLVDPRSGEEVGQIPCLEKLFLDPAKGTAKFKDMDFRVRSGPVGCDTTPRAVMLVRAKSECVIWVANFQWHGIERHDGQVCMAIITQDAAGSFNKRLLKVKGYIGQSRIEAVEDVPLGLSEQTVQEHAIDLSERKWPQDPNVAFWSYGMNVFLERGQCLAFVAYTSAGAGICEVTVGGCKDGSKFTMKPGWKPLKSGPYVTPGEKIATKLFKFEPGENPFTPKQIRDFRNGRKPN